MSVRDEGFKKVLENYPESQVSELVTYHRKNGGLSRYVKFRYFFESIRNEACTEDDVRKLASLFSEVMMARLLDKKLLIMDSLDFVIKNHKKVPMYIVSGSDEKELNEICKKTGIAGYFMAIYGSPAHKSQLVADILRKNNYRNDQTVLIGDSINDYEASVDNGIDFIGYNNLELDKISTQYIQSFKNIGE
jgi:HAD superfamily hydrolase (TIGR01549 family)